LLKRLLDRQGYDVREASDVAELRGAEAHVAIVNLSAAEQSDQAVHTLRTAYPELIVIVLSEAVGFPQRSEKLRILPKPVRALTVLSFIALSLEEAGVRCDHTRS
jgi:hypothetical protein